MELASLHTSKRIMALKIGIVGVGQVARKNYIPYLAEQSDVTLGYFNRTTEAAIETAKLYAGEVFASMADLAAWKPSAVLVLTSEKARYAVGMELIQLGVKRLFFEKPLVAAKGQAHVGEQDFVDARTMLALAKEKGCETAMVFNYRFFEQSLAAKQIAEERNFGPVINVIGEVHYACWSHCIDLIHHFAGSMEEAVALEGKVIRHGQGIEAPDIVAAFRLENGATGTLLGPSGMKWQHPLFELIFTFRNGRIHLRDIDGSLEVLDGAKQIHEVRSLVRDGSRWTQYSESFKKSLGAYLETLREGKIPPIDGSEGLRELQFEAALKRAIGEKRPVKVQSEFPI